MRPAAAALVAGLAVPALAAPPAPRVLSTLAPLAGESERLGELYRELHASPELSMQETATAAKLAGRLRALGFEVTEGGRGGGDRRRPPERRRAGRDAPDRPRRPPVEERTGLPFASRATGKARTVRRSR
jgi:Metal-dependent amidase/aminoacylase/carboxypeptidase